MSNHLRNPSELGERLLCLLRSDEGQMDNTVHLLCGDRTTLRRVHRDVLIASSTFFRRILLNRSATRPLERIPVPVRGPIVDLVTEFLYTTRFVPVQIQDMVELYAAADLFELDGLTSQLERMFHDNLAKYLDHEELFTNQKFENMCLFMKACAIPLKEACQLRLCRKIQDWANLQGIPSSGAELIAQILAGPSAGMNEENEYEAVPVLVTEENLFELDTDRLIKINDCCADRSPSFLNPLLLNAGELFVLAMPPNIWSWGVSVLDIKTGKHLRSYDKLSRCQEIWSYKLTAWRNRVYTWYENNVYELTPNHAIKEICTVKHSIEQLQVAGFDNEHPKFVYNDHWGGAYMYATRKAQETVLHDPSVRNRWSIVGVHNDDVFAWTLNGELIVVRDTQIIASHSFRFQPTSWVSCGRKVYLKHGDITVLDTETGSVNTVNVGLFKGRLTAWQGRRVMSTG